MDKSRRALQDELFALISINIETKMEEDNNNLGDFFRKRLSSLEGGEEDWFNPDSRVDDQVLQGLVASSKKEQHKKRWFFMLLPCLIFLGMLGYIAHLKHHIALLNNTTTKLLAEKTSTPLTSTTIHDDTTTFATLTSPTIITTKNKNTLGTPTNQTDSNKIKEQAFKGALEIENEALQQLIRQKNKRIQALQFELSQNCKASPLAGGNTKAEGITRNTEAIEFKRLFPGFNAPSISINESQTIFGTNNLFLQDGLNEFPLLLTPEKLEKSQEFKDLATLKTTFLIDSSEQLADPIADYTFSLKKHKKRKQHSLEIGLNVGVHVLFTEKATEILTHRIVAKEDYSGNEMNAPYIGLNIAYSPVKNLWIRTGAQIGGNRATLSQKMGIVYSDEDEYVLPSGGRGSDLVLNTSTGYTEKASTLQLKIPSTTANGDLIELDYHDQLNTTHLQIPLGVEYFFGSKKWQPFIHLGAKWNTFNYEYKTLLVNIESRNQAIDFDLVEGSANTRTFHYISLMTGAGINWNLRPQLSLRSTFGVEGNFFLNDTQSTTTTNYPKNSLFVHFGLYYKF